MDTKSATSSLPPAEVDEVIGTWVDILKTPSITGGHLTEDDNFLNISTTWSLIDPGKKEAVKFQRTFTLLKSSLNWKDGSNLLDTDELVISASSPIPIEAKATCVSRDGSRKAILVDKVNRSSDTGGKETQFLQIWSKDRLLKSYDLGELDKHKAVYTAGEFGAKMVWNESGDKLAYLAEKKVPKPRPFYSSDVQSDDNANMDNGLDKKEGTKGPKGEEFALNQTWGEQLVDMYFSVVVILDTTTDKFHVIEMPSDQFPADVQWVNDTTIIGTSYQIPEWRLGLIYCTNRESRIFQVNTDGTSFKFLSAAGRGAFCPRVRPDQKYVIWQERAVDGPHDRSRNIMGTTVGDSVDWPVCLYESVPPNLPIYNDFPLNCWKRDGSEFLTTTPFDGVTSLIGMRPDNGKVESRTIFNGAPGVDSVLWVGENYILISRSSTLATPFVEVVEVSGDFRRAALTKSLPVTPHSKYSTSKIFGKASIPSFFVGPEGCPTKSVPLIVWVHGGPHSCFLDSYMAESSVLARLGFSFLKINYIGSLGGTKRDETDDLLGRIGTLDVNDCQEILEKTLQTYSCIDPERIGVWGGSHGGFLTCHLISQFPDSYKAGVARNPVTDLNVLLGISDITDWGYAEAGLPLPANWSNGFMPAVKSTEEAEKLFKASPISHVSKVKAATLICIGTEDLRVPSSQGYSFYRALKAYGKTAEVRVYPDCHPLSKGPTRVDNIIHAMLWFKKFVK